MATAQKIEGICAGKKIRIFSVQLDRNSVSFVESFRNCGKKNCTPCTDKLKKPHGPYWTLNYIDEAGKSRSLYVGKKLPMIAHDSKNVAFADVVAFYDEREKHKHSVGRYQAEISRLKHEIQLLVQEVLVLRRISTKKKPANGSADKVFRNLVVKYHPDRNAHRHFSAEDVMKDINQLYRELLKG